MAEVFGPAGDDIWGLDSSDDVEVRLHAILSKMITDMVHGRMVLAFDLENPDEMEVLVDLIDGNTLGMIARDMCDSSPHPHERREGTEWLNAMDRIDRKLSETGLAIRFNR